ncbi:hypothetical protein AB0C34_22335 [Nocardia sp. NPDC049220]|uniref:hypothetical protein n=1 Tax=Nocardia sp. NPDC049220 TaxID=3155273 RepID=UPI0033F80FBF
MISLRREGMMTKGPHSVGAATSLSEWVIVGVAPPADLLSPAVGMGNNVKIGLDGERFVDMVSDFDQDPQDWRRRRGVNHDMVPALLERAKNDPDYKAKFIAENGYAAYAFLESYALPHLRDRVSGWTSVADGRQGTGDNSGATAGAIEDTDGAGGTRVRRTSPEA